MHVTSTKPEAVKLAIDQCADAGFELLILSFGSGFDFESRDAAYQKSAPHTALAFPPGSSWLVYTDQVLHAALAGEFALEQTFHFDIARMGAPERAPLKVLERMTGRVLV